ncbi:MAG: autotransporter outer membrane beta-barrel domain-containing protein [Endomicrobium sp.]|nr:autotransporter outer membrane beta-barrel domain-containing protein [Endomicrobium sp.]
MILFVVSVTLVASQAFAEKCKYQHQHIYPFPLLRARIAGGLCANQATDILTDQGLASAIKVVNSNSSDTFSLFGACSYGVSEEYKYKTGSREYKNVKLEGPLFLGGIAKKIDLDCGRLLLAVFGDHDKINYDSLDAYTKHYNNYETEGYHSKYNGGGLLGRFDFKNNLYGELSGRAGNIQADIYGLYYDYPSNNPIPAPKFLYRLKNKCDSLCLGWHAGLGYLFKFNNTLGLDTYGRYFFMRQKYENIFNELIEFSDVDSKRLKVGAKLLYNPNPIFSIYAAAGYEYEFDGNFNMAIKVNRYYPLSNARFEGGTNIYELGGTANTGYFCIGLSLQKHTGMREGYTVAAKISIASLNFLGLSTEKFEKEETGRFEEIFNMSQKICFEKSLKIIKELRARVVNKSLKKGYIVAFDFPKSFDCCLDSTEVGIFITNEGHDKVKVKVISNSSSLAKDVSIKFFEMLKSSANSIVLL